MLEFLDSNKTQYADAIAAMIDRHDTAMRIDIKLFVFDRIIEIPPDALVGMTIRESYMTAHRASIHVELQLTPKQVILLYKTHQDLKANVSAWFADNTAKTRLFEHNYVVLLQDYRDVDKMLSRTDTLSLDNSEQAGLIDITLELIPEFLYHLKRSKINCILRNVTMYDTLMAICSMYGYEQVHIAPPDNTVVYTNMIIPALSSVDDVFDFLQSSPNYHGVYDAGMGYFCYSDTMYIYPRFANMDTQVAARFFNAGEYSYPDTTSTHHIHDMMLDIAITSKVMIKDMSTRLVENVATAFSITNSDRLLDGITYMEKGIPTLRHGIVEVLAVQDKRLAASVGAFNQSHVKTRNTSECRSRLYANFEYSAEFLWSDAVPYLLDPSMRIAYVVDSENGARASSGVVSTITYVFRRTTAVENDIFSCSAKVVLLLDKFN